MKNAPITHRLEYAAYVPFRWLLTQLPESAIRAIGRAIGQAFYVLGRDRRRVALSNLELALPELSPAERQVIAKSSFRNFGDSLTSTLASSKLSAEELEQKWVLEGWENFEAVARRGKGLILLSAHLGTWEIAAYPAPLRGFPIDAIARPPDNPYLLAEMKAIRCRFGNSMISKKGAARVMLRVLRQGGSVGILIDQRAKRNEGELLPFFGHPARTSTLVARMSMKTGAAVVPIFSRRLPDGRWLVKYQPGIEPSSVTQAAGHEHALALTQRYLDTTEAEIRAHPEQWLWMHDRWGQQAGN